MSIDVSPTKEIRGINFRILAQWFFVVVTIVFSTARTMEAVNRLSETTKDLQQQVREMQQENNTQHRLTDIRLTRIETTLKLRQ